MAARGFLASVGIALLLTLATATAEEAMPVRKGQSGICHDPGSSSYNQLKNYTTYSSLTECVAAGGHLRKDVCVPCKSTRADGAKAIYDTDDINIVKKSRDGVCHDAKQATFSSIVKFTAYANLQDCVEDGGRLAAEATRR